MNSFIIPLKLNITQMIRTLYFYMYSDFNVALMIFLTFVAPSIFSFCQSSPW